MKACWEYIDLQNIRSPKVFNISNISRTDCLQVLYNLSTVTNLFIEELYYATVVKSNLKTHRLFFTFLLFLRAGFVFNFRFRGVISNHSHPWCQQKSVRSCSRKSCLVPDLGSPWITHNSDNSEFDIDINFSTVNDFRTDFLRHFPRVFLLYFGGTITLKQI